MKNQTLFETETNLFFPLDCIEWSLLYYIRQISHNIGYKNTRDLVRPRSLFCSYFGTFFVKNLNAGFIPQNHCFILKIKSFASKKKNFFFT